MGAALELVLRRQDPALSCDPRPLPSVITGTSEVLGIDVMPRAVTGLHAVRRAREKQADCSGCHQAVATVEEVLQVQIGQQVQVHVRYTDSWATGFEVADVVPGGCRLRRKSDGSVLPVLIAADDLRPLSANV